MPFGLRDYALNSRGGGKRRQEFQASHGLRKWFKTRCEKASMKSINIEILMGHRGGCKIVEREFIQSPAKHS